MNRALRVAILIGLSAAAIAAFIPTHSGNVGDFVVALDTAQAIVEGRDPYAFVANAAYIPYPLPIALFGLPLLWLPWPVAAIVFVGVSSALLAWGILRSGEAWRLWIFVSFPFLTALYFRQWAPLITAAWFIPALGPLLVLIKPQIALPVVLQRLTWPGVALAGVVLLGSLLLDPTWPLRWLSMLGPYERVIPVLELPFGPLLLFAVVAWRDPRARMLLLMALLPMRGLYDLCPLWIVPRTRQHAAQLSLVSWLMYPLMVVSNNTAVFVVPMLYIPALMMVVWPMVRQKYWSERQ